MIATFAFYKPKSFFVKEGIIATIQSYLLYSNTLNNIVLRIFFRQTMFN